MEPRISKLIPRICPCRDTSKGVALVIVLGFLVLITSIIVAFFSSVTTEYSTAKIAAAGSTGKELADATVQVVMGQIRQATSQGAAVAWASQPGLIRTYADGTSGGYTASGNPLAYYKLYSSDNMVVSTDQIGEFNPKDDVPDSWHSQPALYADLNDPVVDSSGTLCYPIINPSAFGIIEGASITGAPTEGTTNPSPMPAKWLYMLRDGTLIAPASSGSAGNVAVFTGASPSKDNPIVGRIAFWTDDETAKVNINTASEGTFWDVPRCKTTDNYDYNVLAKYQPAHHEFQRYPGHPAMTSLSTVFPSLTADQVYNLVPRINGGGSKGGTQIATGALTQKTDRLYASVDELVFTAARTENAAGLTGEQIEQSRFFLTAHSRAPETNLFNRPRIACWPIYKDLAIGKVTSYDKLIAFCSSIAGKPYYFQRENPLSKSNDISIARNGELYSYLQNITSQNIPGFGGNFNSKYSWDRDQILTEIFDYIRCINLSDDNLPGNQFTSATTGTGWVVPSVHPSNGTMGFGRVYSLSEFGIGFISNADQSLSDSNKITGAGTNLVLGGTALQANEMYIQAIVVPEFFSPMLGYPRIIPNMQIQITGLQNLTVTVGSTTSSLGFPIPSGTNNSTFYSNSPSYMLSGRSYGGNPSWRMFGNYNGSTCKGSPARGNLPQDSGDLYPFIGVPIKISTAAGSMTFNGGNVSVNIYGGKSSSLTSANLIQTINLYLPPATFPLPKIVSAGTDPYASSPSNGVATTQQTWWTFARNGCVTGGTSATGNIPGRLAYLWQYEGSAASPCSGAFFRNGYDVVRTLLPKHGDYRLVAARPSVSDDVFGKHPDYDAIATRMASNFTCSVNSSSQGYDKGGRYIGTLDYNTAALQPDIASSAYKDDPANLTPTVTGDYDSGLPWNNDGPFINKPDEGSIRTDGSVPYFDNETLLISGGISFFSPNRQMPSPGMFGSLPTGILTPNASGNRGIPWKTLLFRPQSTHPSYVDPNNYAASASKPSDHLFLDLFWMPVVEPYAISDRFSTAGKINMNYQIAPFAYIERSTGLRALLKSEMVTAIPNTALSTYKSSWTQVATPIRLKVDAAETLSQFKARFAAGRIFKSASEICDLHIVPVGQTASTMNDFTSSGFWPTHALTGENLREKIYSTLYPRLTTKSNSYTVHFRVQALKKVPGTSATQWVENRDQVVSEYRGSSLIERYIDTEDPDLPDFATQTGGNSTRFPNVEDRFNAENYYKFRVVTSKKFTAE